MRCSPTCRRCTGGWGARGTTAADASGNNRTGTLVGGAGLGQPGGLNGDGNRALSFDGTHDAVVRNPTTGISGAALTVDLWVKTPNTSGDAAIVSYGTDASPTELQLREPRALAVLVQGVRVNTGVALNDGLWHHLAVTWSSNGGVLRVYKDGGLAYLGSVRAGASIAAGGALVLGQDHDWTGGSLEAVQGFVGQLDDVAVYPRVLTQARVQAHRYAGTLSTCSAGLSANTASAVLLAASVPGAEGFCPLGDTELATEPLR